MKCSKNQKFELHSKIEKIICKKDPELLITHVTIDFDSTTIINLTILGTGLSSVKEIFIDQLIMKDFIIVNNNKILAIIPEVNKNSICISVSNYSSTSNCVVCDLGESPVIRDITPSRGSMGPS